MIPVALPTSMPSPVVLSHAMSAVQGFGDSRGILVVVDMGEPNIDRRLWVIDLKTATVVLQTQVAHGSGSDPNHTGMAQRFGNKDGSLMTSLGRTESAMHIRDSLAYRLTSLSPSNSDAWQRDVVLQRASQVPVDLPVRSTGTGMSGTLWMAVRRGTRCVSLGEYVSI